MFLLERFRADQLQWSSCTKVRGCFCVGQFIWLDPMSFWVGAQPASSEWWLTSCQSSYQNYTWCLSGLSLSLFRLTACVTSKSYLILSAHWLTFQRESSGIADGPNLAKSCVSVWIVCIKMHAREWAKNIFMSAVRDRLEGNFTLKRSFWLKLTLCSPMISVIHRASQIMFIKLVLCCTALEDVLSEV